MEFERAAFAATGIKLDASYRQAKVSTARGGRSRHNRLHGQGQACVQVFFIRANQNWGNRDYYPRRARTDAAEVLEGLLSPVLRTEAAAAADLVE